MRAILRLGVPMTALMVLAIACADADEPNLFEPDAGGTVPEVDASHEDAGPDPDRDADAAPARECSDDGFCHTALPKNQVLRDVWGDGAGTVWAVSEQGFVLRWDGSKWNQQADRLGFLTRVWGASATDVWVGGQDGLFHGTGASPDKLTFVQIPEIVGEIVSIWGQGPADVWAVLAAPEGSQVLHYADVEGQLGWSPVTLGTPESRFARVWGGAGTGVWVSGFELDFDWFVERGVVYRLLPGATDFEPVPMPGFPGMDPENAYWSFGEVVSASIASDEHIVLQARAVEGGAMIVRGSRANTGEDFTFEAEIDGTFQDPSTHAILSFGPNDLWTAGEHGRIRHWDGSDWTPMAVTITKYPMASPVFGLWAKTANDFWAVGDNIAFHYDPTKR